MDNLTPEQRHKNMSAIRNKDTSIEIVLRKELWKRNIRYRKNSSAIPGKPDIALTKYKIAIFCDSEFWHGHDWDNAKERLKSNRNYWIPKIERNIERDKEVNKKLKELGWIVLRFWGKEIKKNMDICMNIIMEAIKARNGG